MAEPNGVDMVSSDKDIVHVDHANLNNAAHEPAAVGQEEVSGEVFQLTVNLPHDPHKIQIIVSSQEQIHDVRQSIIELPGTYQYSCFHLEHKGQRINDFIQISEVDGLAAGSELRLVEDPYTENEARIHVIRIRELIGASADRVDTAHGILSGLSLHDSIASSEANSNGSSAPPSTAVAGYDFQAPGTLATLLPRPQNPPPKTVKSISVSPWNPPPYHLRQRGHLLYLQVMTIEGEQFQITSHVSGFYVNKCSNSKFDPLPKAAPKSHAAHSLLTLISDLSLSFGAAFQRLLDFNNLKEPLASLQITNATPASPWAVSPPSSPAVMHQADIMRTQESYLMYGVENMENLRDWNEEFQSTRELPKDTVQDRVFRERLTSKLFADYTDAASQGAVLVARGEVAPLNPTEAKDAQIFVYNNIFFSFGADGVGTFATEGGNEAARAATGRDVMGVRMVNQFDIDGLFTPGTVVVDYLGKRIVGQSIVPGIFKQREPGENQIDYGAVDGCDVIASDERFVSVFEKLSKSLKTKRHPVWDKEGKRHDLEGSLETKGLLGTDGRKYILDLFRITPLDVAWIEENMPAANSDRPNEASGTAQPPYPHRTSVLRPELVEAYWKVKMRAWVDSKLQEKKTTQEGTSVNDMDPETKSGEDAVASKNHTANGTNGAVESSTEVAQPNDSNLEKINISDFTFALNPDVFCGQKPQSEAEKEEWANDEQDVRHACDYLRNTVLQGFIHDLKEGDVGFPMDGGSLSRLLHRRGINVRYIGKLATLAEGKKLEALRVLITQEMIARAFKHTAARYLRDVPSSLAGACIAHLLNCLLGTSLNAHPKAEVDETLALLYPGVSLYFQELSPDRLKIEIEEEIFLRYRFHMKDGWNSEIKHVQLLREISLKLGLQLEAKDYCFTNALSNGSFENSPVDGKPLNQLPVNGHSTSSKKKKKARDGSPSSIASGNSSPAMAFSPDNILNIVPLIKETSPRSMLAEEALEAGRISILQNQKKLGQELLLESLSLHEQIYGLLHPEVARVYNSLSMLYYQLDEKDAAIELAHKAVVVSERTLGIDNAETLLNYLNLGLIAHACGETKQALIQVRHALEVWKIVYGPNHPDSITTINNAAVMLQTLKEYRASRIWFEEALKICENIYGRHHVNAATLLFQLAQAFALDQDPRASVTNMRESYNIFLAELGPNDKNTKEAEQWLERLTQNAVSVAKQAKDLQARNRFRIGVRSSSSVGLGQTHPQRQVGQTAEAASGREPPANAMGLDSRSVDELIKYIEGTDQKKSPKKRQGHSNPKRRGGAAVAGK